MPDQERRGRDRSGNRTDLTCTDEGFNSREARRVSRKLTPEQSTIKLLMQAIPGVSYPTGDQQADEANEFGATWQNYPPEADETEKHRLDAITEDRKKRKKRYSPNKRNGKLRR